MSIVERVREIIEPLLATQSLTVYDVEISGSQVRITIESPDGLDLDTIAGVTRQISMALDEHDPIPHKYTLEVSSPGLERALHTPSHFAGAVGSAVSVKTVPTFDGERRIKGKLTAADGDGITVDGTRLSYRDIEKARTIFEWGPPPKPGKPRASKTKAKVQ